MKKILITLITIIISLPSTASADNHIYAGLDLGILTGSNVYAGVVGVTNSDFGVYLKKGVVEGRLDGNLLGGGIIFSEFISIGMGMVDYDYKNCEFAELDGGCDIVNDGSDFYLEGDLFMMVRGSSIVFTTGMKLLPESTVMMGIGLGLYF